MLKPQANPTIQCTGLSKNFRVYEKGEGIRGSIRSFFHREYRDVPAVQDFDLEIYPNEIIGLLGPNGAGKTTLMKMLTGIIVPSAGEASVLGHQPSDRKRPFRKEIALVMGQKSQLWWDIPAMDSLRLLQRYYELEETEFNERLNTLAELFNVNHLLSIHVRKLSLGERMKMELMASLLHKPRVIFLDEPTIGLDVVAQSNIREFLRAYHQDHNTTIVLTSHYMGDVQALAERIVLILAGKKRFDGTIREFETLFGSEKYVLIQFNDPVPPEDTFFDDLEPTWNDSRQQVEVRIPDEKFCELSQKVFSNYAVTHFSTDQLPIERVMTSLLKNPNLLPS